MGWCWLISLILLLPSSVMTSFRCWNKTREGKIKTTHLCQHSTWRWRNLNPKLKSLQPIFIRNLCEADIIIIIKAMGPSSNQTKKLRRAIAKLTRIPSDNRDSLFCSVLPCPSKVYHKSFIYLHFLWRLFKGTFGFGLDWVEQSEGPVGSTRKGSPFLFLALSLII